MLDPLLLRGQFAATAERLRVERGFDLGETGLDALEVERKVLQTRTQELQNLRGQPSQQLIEAINKAK